MESYWQQFGKPTGSKGLRGELTPSRTWGVGSENLQKLVLDSVHDSLMLHT